MAILVAVAAGSLGGSAAHADSRSCVGPAQQASYASTTSAVQRYAAALGEYPRSLGEVVDAGYLNSVPLDVVYDPVDGEVSCAGASTISEADASAAVGFTIVLLIVLFVGYFIPTIVAVARGLPSVGGVIAVNVFLGWSVIGWAVALAMALRSKPPTYRLATSAVGYPSVGHGPAWMPPGGYPPPPGAGYPPPPGSYPPPSAPPAGWAPPVGPHDRTF